MSSEPLQIVAPQLDLWGPLLKLCFQPVSGRGENRGSYEGDFLHGLGRSSVEVVFTLSTHIPWSELSPGTTLYCQGG